MKIFNSVRNKIILLVLISGLVFSGWEFGLEKAYLNTLVGVTNVGLNIFKTDTSIDIHPTQRTESPFEFLVHTVIGDRKGSYNQEIGGILQPFVIVLSWQLFLFFVLNLKSAFWSAGVNIGSFIFIQVVFLFLLTGYYVSDVQKYIYDMLLDSFYIIALVLVIKDNMLYKVFNRKIE